MLIAHLFVFVSVQSMEFVVRDAGGFEASSSSMHHFSQEGSATEKQDVKATGRHGSQDDSSAAVLPPCEHGIIGSVDLLAVCKDHYGDKEECEDDATSYECDFTKGKCYRCVYNVRTCRKQDCRCKRDESKPFCEVSKRRVDQVNDLFADLEAAGM